MFPAGTPWWLSRLIVACVIYFAIAGIIAEIGQRVWGKDPKIKARLDKWRKSHKRTMSLRAKGIGLGFSVLGLPLGTLVDTVAKVRQRRKPETKPSGEKDEHDNGDLSGST